MIRLYAFDELNDEFLACECKILSMDELSREEKSIYAEMLVNKYKERYPEARGFHFEKTTSYRDFDSIYDYFYEIAINEEEMCHEEADIYATECTRAEEIEYYDLGFDY